MHVICLLASLVPWPFGYAFCTDARSGRLGVRVVRGIGRTRMLKRLEKYEIVDEIGHGGMATVYRARDTRLDRDGRAQGHASAPAGRQGSARALRARGADDRAPQAPVDPRDLRLQRRRIRHELHRDRAAHRAHAQAVRRCAPRHPAPRSRPASRSSSRARSAAAHAEGCPSRREARERAAAREPLREADRLRHRAAGRRAGHDHDRAGARLACAHGARADRGQGMRSAQRSVLARHRALHARHRRAAVHRQQPAPGAQAHHGGPLQGSAAGAAVDRRQARGDHPPLARARSRRSATRARASSSAT